MRILLCVYDNGSHISQPPHGLAYLASALCDAGHFVDVWDAAVNHYPPRHLTEHIDRTKPDVVAVSCIAGYWQYRQLLALSEAVNASSHRQKLWFILGGHGPASDPEYFLRRTKADTVFVGEGEISLPKALKTGNRDRVIQGEQVDPDAIGLPTWSLFNMDVYRLQRYPKTTSTDFAMPVLSGRGCPFHCTFCYRMTPGWRPRAPESIASEIRWLQRVYGVTYVNFDDELLMLGEDRTIAVCNALAPLGIRWMCNGRLNYATRDLVTRMKDAGCVFINYGIEALDDNVLRLMGKQLTVAKIHAGIRATLDAGVSPGLNVLWNNRGDTVETLDLAVRFLLEYDDGAQCRNIRPMTPYPGSPAFTWARKRGLVKDTEDFYEHKHINSDLIAVNMMTGISTEDAHEALLEANQRLLSAYRTRWASTHEHQLTALYVNNDATFRGWRHG